MNNQEIKYAKMDFTLKELYNKINIKIQFKIIVFKKSRCKYKLIILKYWIKKAIQLQKTVLIKITNYKVL